MRILICEDDPSRSEALGASVAIACPGAEVQRAVPGTSVARAVAEAPPALTVVGPGLAEDRKSTRLNSSHRCISYAVFCLKKKKAETRAEVNSERWSSR